jgi:hypothetical protein
MLFSQVREGFLNQPERGLEIHRQREIKLVIRQLLDRTDGVDARVVHDDVEPSEALHRLGNDAFHLGPMAHVGLVEPRRAATLDDGIRHGVAIRLTARGDDDLGAGLGEYTSDALTDALAGAGDDCNFAG